MDSDQEFTTMELDRPCPHCGTVGLSPRATRVRYNDIIDWIAQYATAGNSRDHAAAVIMLCALGEALEADLIRSYLEFHPMSGRRFPGARLGVPSTHPTFKTIFGATLKDVLSSAPADVADFAQPWLAIVKVRNSFLHGKSTDRSIAESDAFAAMDLILPLLRASAWVNNACCIRP
jgi:hypothetical protein